MYQVSASLDALIEISSGKVNIHVLMAMAAFASVFMGNSLEGGLLLAMFNLAHIGELFGLIRLLKFVVQSKIQWFTISLICLSDWFLQPRSISLAVRWLMLKS